MFRICIAFFFLLSTGFQAQGSAPEGQTTWAALYSDGNFSALLDISNIDASEDCPIVMAAPFFNQSGHYEGCDISLHFDSAPTDNLERLPATGISSTECLRWTFYHIPSSNQEDCGVTGKGWTDAHYECLQGGPNHRLGRHEMQED